MILSIMVVSIWTLCPPVKIIGDVNKRDLQKALDSTPDNRPCLVEIKKRQGRIKAIYKDKIKWEKLK